MTGAAAPGPRTRPPHQAAASAAEAAKASRKASCHKTTRWASRDQQIQMEAKPVRLARRIPPATSPASTAGSAQTSTATKETTPRTIQRMNPPRESLLRDKVLPNMATCSDLDRRRLRKETMSANLWLSIVALKRSPVEATTSTST